MNDTINNAIDALKGKAISDNLSSQITNLQDHVQTLTYFTIIIIFIIVTLLLLVYWYKTKKDRELNDIVGCLQEQLNSYQSRLCKAEELMKEVSLNTSTVASQEPPQLVFSPKEEQEVNVSSSVSSHKETIVRYATIQEPDREGKLKMAERSMVSAPSPEKWFKVEFDEGSNHATYSINQESKQNILNDLDTMQKFCNSFYLPINPHDIKVEKKGKLVKEGRFWIVTEKISIKLV